MRRKSVYFRRHLLSSVFVILGSSMLHEHQPQLASFIAQPMGIVKGSVMDANGAVIVTPRPSITFAGRNCIKTVAANDRGDYQIILPAGVYKVTTEMRGFYPLRRSDFRVLPDSTVTINVVLSPRYLTRGTTVSVRASVDTRAPAPKYNEFHVPGSSLGLLIQFQGKRKTNRHIEYNGATLTYDALTIYADKICFNKTRLQLKAFGKRVVVEDGKRVQVKQATVAFKGGELILDLTN